MQELTPEEIRRLAHEYLAGTISEADRERLDAWYRTMPEQVQWPEEEVNRDQLRTEMLTTIHERTMAPVVPLRKRVIRWVAAAAILVVAGTGAWMYFNRQTTTPSSGIIAAAEGIPYKNDIAAPQYNKATLTVEGANSKTIVLSDQANGPLADAGIMGAVKNADDKLSYHGVANNNQVVYQTLVNPKFSRPISLTLPDGSTVWLNAASSIRFPNGFTGSRREVSITGEAYFEVRHNEKQPFRVLAGAHIVEDLGTAFNVKAYADEPAVKTTLIEGSVQIGNVVMNQPGQQLNGNQLVHAQIAYETAWKNGEFFFRKATVESVLQQAARWYDIEVMYEAHPTDLFTVNVNRSLPISQMLRYMEQSGGVHFEIQGNKIIVKK